MAFLETSRLTKRFGDLVVLDALSLDVAEGEVLALLGPSGSGKTTFLRLLAGFETADAGTIRAAGRDVTRLAPAARGFGMVFQHYALFPHLTVRGNVAFGLEARRWEKGAIARRVEEVLALVDLDGFGDRPVGALSGGQQQRVALARALAPDPPLLLLDEPLSNLDPSLRERTRRELLAAIRRVGITTVLVTHEQDEAFHLGDRVAVLWRGRLQQVGSPEELYLQPANRFVASFIGRSTALPGVVAGRDGDGRCRVRLELPAGGAGATEPSRQPVWAGIDRSAGSPGGRDGGGLAEGAEAVLVVRPECLWLERIDPLGGTDATGAEGAVRPDQADGPDGPHGTHRPDGPEGSLVGRVVGRRYGGPVTYYQVEVGPEAGSDPGSGSREGAGFEVEVLAGRAAAEEGDRVRIGLRARDAAPGRNDGSGGPGGDGAPAARAVPPPAVFSRSAEYEAIGPANGWVSGQGAP